jgi:hypothetical protein
MRYELTLDEAKALYNSVHNPHSSKTWRVG